MADKWTKDEIRALLEKSDEAVERGLVAIYNRQTASEQSAEYTHNSNGIGFNAFDAKSGTYYAKWVLKGKHLTGDFIAKGRRLALKYVRQLTDIANGGTTTA